MKDVQVLIHYLEQKAHAQGTFRNSWEGYTRVLRFVEAALQRLPSPQDLETSSIDARFTTELEQLAQMVVDLFPTDSFEELATFLVTASHTEEHA